MAKKKEVKPVEKVVYARLNFGRWIADCPDDVSKTHAMPMDPLNPSAPFVCAACYPDVRAKAFQKGADELFRPVDDPVKQQAAKDKAVADGHSYRVVFPDNLADIMAVLRYRPVEHMHWEPGESLEFLKLENAQHGVAGPIPAQVSSVNPGGE
jgi:hypothetical protein